MRLLLAFLISISAAFGQTQAVPSPVPVVQYLDQNGKPLSGAFICSFAGGTSTPQATYTDSTASTQNTNPIVLDVYGRASIWLKQQSYKLVLYVGGNGACPGTGAVQWSSDNIWAIFQQVNSLNSLIGTVTLAGTANQVIITPSGNTLTFTLPQSIATTSNVTFANIAGTKLNMTAGPLTIGGTYTVVDTSENINGNSYSVNGTGIVDAAYNALFHSLSIIGVGTPTIDDSNNISGHSLSIGGGVVIDDSKNATVHNLSISGTCAGCPGGWVGTQSAGSHVLGTQYTNSGTTPKFIGVSVTLTGGTTSTVVAYTDSLSPPATVVGAAAIPSGVASMTQSFSFWVLPGNNYLVKVTGGTVGLGSWVEWF